MSPRRNGRAAPRQGPPRYVQAPGKALERRCARDDSTGGGGALDRSRGGVPRRARAIYDCDAYCAECRLWPFRAALAGTWRALEGLRHAA